MCLTKRVERPICDIGSMKHRVYMLHKQRKKKNGINLFSSENNNGIACFRLSVQINGYILEREKYILFPGNKIEKTKRRKKKKTFSIQKCTNHLLRFVSNQPNITAVFIFITISFLFFIFTCFHQIQSFLWLYFECFELNTSSSCRY